MARLGPTRVVIFGEHSQDWMDALRDGAPVWQEISEVEEVLVVPDLVSWHEVSPCNSQLRTVVIPLMENHTRDCPRDCYSLIPDTASLDALGNKRAFADYVVRHGLEQNCVTTFDHPGEIVFPCVVKRTDLNAGNGVVVATSPEHFNTIMEQPLWRGHDVIVQPVVGGTEYVTHCVCKNGRVLWNCTFIYVLIPDHQIRTPENVRYSWAVVIDNKIISAIAKFIEPLNYTGPLNADYIITPSRELAVLEINPRLGGSLMKPENRSYLAAALSCILDHAIDRAIDHAVTPGV